MTLTSSANGSAANSYRKSQPWKAQPSHLLTVAQAAEQLGFTEGTLRRYCDRGRIGYITWRWRYGIIARARRYIPKAALNEFLERRVVSRTAQRASEAPSHRT